MSYKSLLSDRCDIYHLKEDHAEEARYGIPAPNLQPIRTYGETPDLQNVPCYFTEKKQSIVQQDPEQVIYHSYLAHFPADADVRLHDQAVSYRGRWKKRGRAAFELKLPSGLNRREPIF